MSEESPSRWTQLGQTLADEAVNALAVVTIGYMTVVGSPGYEPVAAIMSIALGAKYLKERQK